MRLRARLTLFFALVIALGAATSLLLVRTATVTLFRSLVTAGDAAKAESWASILAAWYAERGSWEGLQPFLEAEPQRFLGDRVTVTDAAGLVIADTTGTLLGSVHPPRHLVHGLPILSAADGVRIGTVLVGSLVESSLSGADERFLSRVTASLALATAASAALALALGLLFAARVTRPLRALDAAVGRVARGDLGVELPTAGDDEIAGISVSFNAMTRELRRLEDARRRIIADSAHELRTPVTLIRGTLEAMLDGVLPTDRGTLESVHGETLRLSRLIDALRELELIDSGRLALALEPLDPLVEARKAVARFAMEAAERGLALGLAPAGGRMQVVPRIAVDPLRLGEILDNLIGNALAYTPRGGRVLVSVEPPGAADAAQRVALLVDDSGPGIPPGERERVFERFHRLDPSRSANSGGRGLGLSIAREIARAHGGELEARDSPLGGARLVALVPVSRPGA